MHPIFKPRDSTVVPLPSFMILYLVGGWAYPSEKWWSSLVGMMKFPTEWKVIKFMFQTTNQLWSFMYVPIFAGSLMVSAPWWAPEIPHGDLATDHDHFLGKSSTDSWPKGYIGFMIPITDKPRIFIREPSISQKNRPNTFPPKMQSISQEIKIGNSEWECQRCSFHPQ